MEPDTQVSESRVIAMRAFPGLLLQSIAGKATRADFESVAERMFDHPLLGHRYVQISRIAPTGVKDAPDDDFRKRAAEFLEEQGERIAAFAYVVVGDGFLAATARAVITGISVLSRPRHPVKVFAEPLPAASWVREHGASPGVCDMQPEQIVAALDELLLTQRAG